MATTTHSNPNLTTRDHAHEEPWDEAIAALLAAGDVDGAKAELDRQIVASLDSADPVLMTPEQWEEMRAELHRYSDHVQAEQGSSSAEAERGDFDKPRLNRPGQTVDEFLHRGDIPGAKAELGRLLVAGMTSVRPIEATPEFFENARDRLRRKAEQIDTKKSA